MLAKAAHLLELSEYPAFISSFTKRILCSLPLSAYRFRNESMTTNILKNATQYEDY